MAITARTNRNKALLTQGHMRHVFGTFADGATTAEVDVADFKHITGVIPGYVGAPAVADGPISVNEVAANDKLTMPATKKITVQRVAATTNGLGFCLVVFGN
jgi:hypothetical protein